MTFEPPHRHNPDGTGISGLSATATRRRLLRFQKCRKPAWGGHCGVVADGTTGRRKCTPANGDAAETARYDARSDVGFWGRSRNLLLDQSITGFDP
jgi:hypothetical protein